MEEGESCARLASEFFYGVVRRTAADSSVERRPPIDHVLALARQDC